MILLWYVCISYGIVIYATIVIVYSGLELHSILLDITIAYQLLPFRNSGIVYGIVIWVCICIFYCITLHVIWDRVAYYTMLLWHAIGHHFWLMAHHAVMHLFIICIILYCIIHDRIIACHWLSFVGIL